MWPVDGRPIGKAAELDVPRTFRVSTTALVGWRGADEFGFDEESTERLASSSVSELARSSRRRELRFLPALSPMFA